MNETVSSADEFRTKALNVDGILFQRFVRKELVAGGVPFYIEEYPVEFPPPNGPFHGKESRLDLWHRISIGNVEFNLLIETKKADPKLKEWIFFPSGAEITKSFHVGRVAYRQAAPNQTSIQWIPFDGDYVYDGRELRGNWESIPKKDDWKSSHQRTTEAANQIALASQCIWLKKGNLPNVSKTDRISVVVPIIVTNANMFIAEEKAGPSTSDMEYAGAELEYRSVNQLILVHQLSPALQVSPGSPVEDITPQVFRQYSCKDILIVRQPQASQAILSLCRSFAQVLQST